MGGGYVTRSPPNFKQRRQTLPQNRIRAVSNFIPALLVFHDLSKVGDFFKSSILIGLQKKKKIVVLSSSLGIDFITSKIPVSQQRSVRF